MCNRRDLRPLSIAVVAAMLLMVQTPYAHAAQHMSAPAGPSPKEKAKAEEKRAFEKDTDEAYKSTLKQIPEAKQKVDPWGSMRTPPQK
jgi:Spy/CpxP family protein refolding chaperone